MSETHSPEVKKRLLASLRALVRSRPDLADVKDEFREMLRLEKELVGAAAAAPPARDAGPRMMGGSVELPATEGPIFLGADNTGIEVRKVTINIEPVPVGVLNLLDPKTEPLVTVEVFNHVDDNRKKRVAVYAELEGLSCRCVQSAEIPFNRDDPKGFEFTLLPVLLPDKVREINEVRRAALQVRVVDLDDRVESEQTHSVTCLARSSGRNGYVDRATGERKDLTHYYGAWVTPHIDEVLRLLRVACEHHPKRSFRGYVDGDKQTVRAEVAALFAALKIAGITYLNSTTVIGADDATITQRCRLPRESLAHKSANCLDGTVLFASLLEAASLDAAIVSLDGHALVAWKTNLQMESDDEWGFLKHWEFLETTMVGSSDFESAVDAGRRRIKEYQEADKRAAIRFHRLSDLRKRGIYPME